MDSVKFYNQQGRKPDIIAATGDIAYSGKEYGEQATKFFDDLLEATGHCLR